MADFESVMRQLLAYSVAQVVTETPQRLKGWELTVAVGIVVGLALLAVGVLYAFYKHVGRGTFMEDTVRHWIFALRPQPDTVSSVLDEFVTRRYEFLTFFGQFIITALVTSVIAVLLLADRITAEAGLPILATILGIVLGKSVLSRRALPERPPGPAPRENIDVTSSNHDLSYGNDVIGNAGGQEAAATSQDETGDEGENGPEHASGEGAPAGEGEQDEEGGS